jgi:hypothetical protein
MDSAVEEAGKPRKQGWDRDRHPTPPPPPKKNKKNKKEKERKQGWVRTSSINLEFAFLIEELNDICI